MDDPGAFFDLAAHVDPWLDASGGDPGDIDADTRFYRELARDGDGPALELGVGAGRVYLELLEDGIDVDGVDLSRRALDRLRENAADRGLSPTVWRTDVTELSVDREYGVVYAPARVFNHMATVDEQRAVLDRVREALAPNGRFALNTFVPCFDVVVDSYGEPEVDRVSSDGEDYRIVTTSTLADEVEQVVRLHRELYRDGELMGERETPISLIPKRQFELLFEASGFSDWRVFGGFDRDPLESANQEMVWIVDN